MVAAESPLSLTRVEPRWGPRLAAATAEAAHFVHSAGPHFHFNLRLMNAKNSGRKLITPHRGENGR